MRAPRLSAAALFGLGTTVLAVGCAVNRQPPEDLATREVTTPSAFAAAAGQPAGPAADDWLTAFNDPALPALVDEALAHNPDLRMAAAAWRESRARVRVATSYLLPEVNGTGGVTRSRTVVRDTPTQATTYQFALDASWEADLWGKLRSDRDAARLAAESMGLEYAAARQSLAAAVTDAWFTAVQARLQLDIDREQLEAERRTARVTSDKVDVGAGAQLDAELAEANVASAQAAVTADLAAIEELTKALEALLGRYPAAELEVAADLPAFPGEVPTGVPSELLERRPDIVAADRMVAAAFHRTESAKAARLPRLTLTGSLGVVLDPTHSIWSIGSGLLAPIFQGGRLDAQVEIAGAQQEQAVARYVGVAIDAFREVETALANERYLAQREGELTRAVDRLATASRVGENRYDAGILSIVDLTTIRRQYFQSRAELLRVRTERLRQRLTLYRALGGSFDASPALAPAYPDDTAARPQESTQEQTR